MKEFKIHDHLGSVRAVMNGNMIVHEYDYAPFGEVIYDNVPLGGLIYNPGNKERQKYIGKEKDKESSLGDFGVRKITVSEPLINQI